MVVLTRGTGHVHPGAVLVVVLVVLAGGTGSAKTWYDYKVRLGEPGARLDAVAGGGPAWVDFDSTGSNLLVWGHEGPDDIRLLGRDLTTRNALELPSDNFTVKGVGWGDKYDRIVAWGSPGPDLNDTLVFYKSPSWSIEEGLLPEDLLPLVEVDSACFFASDVILSVAGRDVNGSSRLVVVQMADKTVLRNDPMPSDRSVVAIGSDGRYMLVLDDDGGLTVYATTNWTLMKQIDLLPAPFSAYFIESGNIDRVFGGQDGSVATQVDVDRDDWNVFSTGTGPVTGLMFTHAAEERSYIIAAVNEGASASALQIWDPEGGNDWTLHRTSTIDGRVSMLTRDPASNTTVVVAFSDGSVAMYGLDVERYEVDDRPSDWWVPLVVIGTFIVLVLVAVVLLYSRMRRRAKERTD